MTEKINTPLFLSTISDYYSAKIKKHGETAQGVDWNSTASQILRFEQLSKVIAPSTPFSINDLGCGYGAYYDYLSNHYTSFSYEGIDISEEMVNSANMHYKTQNNARFTLSNEPPQLADYGIASGIFNVCLELSKTQWQSYIDTTLNLLDRTSRLGFAFNCLTTYSDADKMHDYLYYANPCTLFDLCKQRYSRNVALLHDYGLYEFTILVRKTS